MLAVTTMSLPHDGEDQCSISISMLWDCVAYPTERLKELSLDFQAGF